MVGWPRCGTTPSATHSLATLSCRSPLGPLCASSTLTRSTQAASPIRRRTSGDAALPSGASSSRRLPIAEATRSCSRRRSDSLTCSSSAALMLAALAPGSMAPSSARPFAHSLPIAMHVSESVDGSLARPGGSVCKRGRGRQWHLFPAPAQGLVDGDQAGRSLSAALRQTILVLELRALGIEHLQKIDQPTLKAQSCQLCGEISFRNPDVRPAAQQTRRVTDGGDRRKGREVFRWSQHPSQGGRLATGEYAEAIDGPIGGRVERADGRERGAELRLGARGIQFGAAAGIQPDGGELQSLLLVIDVAPGDRKLSLQATQFKVGAGDFRRHNDLRVAQSGLGALPLGMAGFNAASHTAKQIEFPGSIEARVVLALIAPERGGTLFLREALLRVSAVRGDCRCQIKPSLPMERARFPYVSERDPQVVILEQRIAHQLVK